MINRVQIHGVDRSTSVILGEPELNGSKQGGNNEFRNH
jgi:hypothetical protein